MNKLAIRVVLLLLFAMLCGWRTQRVLSGNSVTDHAASKVGLGEKLYFEKRLSIDNTVNCATCHDPATAFASKDALAIGVQNQTGTRNAPTLLNVGFGKSYFWDGRSLTLEDQAKQPLLNPAEMGMLTETAVVKRLSSISDYRQQFRRVFGTEGITLRTVTEAIAAYERTLVSRNASFDRFISGDAKAITEAQLRGWKIFKGKAGCIECHTFTESSPLFTDGRFHNTGVAARAQDYKLLIQRVNELKVRSQSETLSSGSLAHRVEFAELGRFLVTDEEKDIGAFKTPTLRDVELTGPYMHNGSLGTLLDVVRFYNQGGRKNPNLDPKMRGLNLSESEMSALVEFLRTLTSHDVLRRAQASKPQTRVAVLSAP